MRRREFLIRSATTAGAVWLSSKSILQAIAGQTLPGKFSASDTITLGRTGIKTSRLAMGTAPSAPDIIRIKLPSACKASPTFF